MTSIVYQSLSIGSVSNTSGVYVGENVQINFEHVSKQNDAFGSVGDANEVTHSVHIVMDDDQVDSAVYDEMNSTGQIEG